MKIPATHLFLGKFQGSQRGRVISDGFGVRASLFREVAEGQSKPLRIGVFRFTKVVIAIDKLRGSSCLPAHSGVIKLSQQSELF